MLRCMRTTLTLDDDVAILLKRLSEERQVSFEPWSTRRYGKVCGSWRHRHPKRPFAQNLSPWGTVSWEIWMISRKC
jgi:hypothetical protein